MTTKKIIIEKRFYHYLHYLIYHRNVNVNKKKKVINAERAAMQAKDFRTKLFRTRKLLISSLIDKSKK